MPQIPSRPAATAAAALAALAHPALADDIRIIELPTNRLAYNAGDGMLYATVPSSAGAPRGNSITPIDPVTGAIGASVFMGSEPLQLAISDSGETIFVALDGTAMVRPFDATTQTPGAAFDLGSGGLSLNYVEDMHVQPGSESVIAISLRNKGFSPRHEGVAIFDDGVKRPMMTPDHTGSNVIAWSDDPGALYGYNNETTEFGLREMEVDSSGVVITRTVGGLIDRFNTDIEYADGFIYSTNGRKIDAASFSLAGTFAASGLVEPDPASGLVFFLETSGGHTLRAFDIETFLEVDSFAIPGASGAPTDLIRWGADGLAYRTDTDQVVLITTSLIPSACYPDCDDSGDLDFFDFLCFQNDFAAGAPEADCDATGTLDFFDFLCFQNAFAAGCP